MISAREVFTMAEISEASGFSMTALQSRIAERTTAGYIEARPRGRKGRPAVYTYDEIKMILFPMPKGQQPVARTNFEPDPFRIAALARQLKTDGLPSRF